MHAKKQVHAKGTETLVKVSLSLSVWADREGERLFWNKLYLLKKRHSFLSRKG